MEGISNLNCGNHKLQNSINDAKKECKEAKEMFDSATRLSNFGRKSPYFHNKMKKYCKKYNHNFSQLKGVSKVRWNCTHQMLKRLLKLLKTSVFYCWSDCGCKEEVTCS